MVTTTDQHGNTISFTYDALGRKVSTNWPDGTQNRSVFDLRLVIVVDAIDRELSRNLPLGLSEQLT